VLLVVDTIIPHTKVEVVLPVELCKLVKTPVAPVAANCKVCAAFTDPVSKRPNNNVFFIVFFIVLNVRNLE
jgi:hypothetical protein